jgi:four helix bundle protein
MSEISDAIQSKCLAFGDRIIKLNDFLLAQAVAAHENYKKSKIQKKGKQTSSFLHQTSDISVAAVPVHLQAVSNLCNQLLRSGTSIGANNAEACNAISRQDFRSKSYIALKEARESLYWIELLHRNNYLDEKQYNSIYADGEELVKILVARCKKLDDQLKEEKK